MPNMTQRFQKGEEGRVTSSTQGICKLFMQRLSGTGLATWIMHASVFSNPSLPRTYHRTWHPLFTHHGVPSLKQRGKVIRCTQKRMFPWKVWAFTNKCILETFYEKWSHVHWQCLWWNKLFAIQHIIWIRTSFLNYSLTFCISSSTLGLSFLLCEMGVMRPPLQDCCEDETMRCIDSRWCVSLAHCTDLCPFILSCRRDPPSWFP